MQAIGSYIKRGESTVWDDVESSPLLQGEVGNAARLFWEASKAEIEEIDWNLEYERVVDTSKNTRKERSEIWNDWASLESNVRLDRLTIDTCTTIDEALKGIKPQTIVAPKNTQLEVAALMCCDEPYQTCEMLMRCFFQRRGVPFGDRQIFSYKIQQYTATMLAAAFLGKKLCSVWRPCNWELLVQGKSKASGTVQRIPHPNHGSLPGGHPTVGQATKKGVEQIAKLELDADFIKGCDEVGESRVVLGIHWHKDLEFAYRMVEHLHPLVMDIVA